MVTPFSFHLPDQIKSFTPKSPQYIKATDGVELAYYDFIPTQLNALMIFYHGGGTWSTRLYQYMAQQLAQKYNIGSYLFDIRGHGNSQGPRGDAPSPEQVWRDISCAIDFVSSKHFHHQIILAGHSAGAGLLLNYNNWYKHPAVKGYIMLAPFLGAQSGTNYEHRDPAKRFVKHIRFLPLIINVLSRGFLCAHIPVIFFNYPKHQKLSDKHLLESYTCAMATAITPRDPKKLFEQLDRPFVMVIGANDEQFIPEKVITYANCALRVRAQSHVSVLPNSTHLSIVVDAVDIIGQAIAHFPR